MNRTLRIAFAFPLLFAASMATTVNHVLSRERLSLDGKWNYIVDPYDSGFLTTEASPTMPRPSLWGVISRTSVTSQPPS